jgi:hypothetical protein
MKICCLKQATTNAFHRFHFNQSFPYTGMSFHHLPFKHFSPRFSVMLDLYESVENFSFALNKAFS